MIKKSLKLGPSDYFLTHLRLINAVLPIRMTEREMLVLAAFMQMGSFNSKSKKGVRSSLGLKPANLSNYLKSLVKKGFVRSYIDEEAHRQYDFRDILLIDRSKQIYQFALINEGPSE